MYVMPENSCSITFIEHGHSRCTRSPEVSVCESARLHGLQVNMTWDLTELYHHDMPDMLAGGAEISANAYRGSEYNMPAAPGQPRQH